MDFLPRIRYLIFKVQLSTRNQMEERHEKNTTKPEQIIHKRRCVATMRQRHSLSERRACAALGVSRSVQRYKKRRKLEEEVHLVAAIIELAHCHRQYGSWRITNMLRDSGWYVNHKPVELIWCEQGLQVPKRVQKRSRVVCLVGRACVAEGSRLEL